MKDKKNNILILGASGYIGNYLFNKFKQEHFNVLGTYSENEKAGLLRFNLDSMNLGDLKLDSKKITHLIIAAAANAKIDESKKYWNHSYKINVTTIKKIINYCFDRKIVPLYLSSDGVFDGKKGNYGENDKTNPINCYGKMRAEVENHILKSKKPFIILRMGRVFGIDMEDGTILTRTLKQMSREKKCLYISDVKFTPVYVDDLYQFMKFLIERKLEGIFHIASLKPTTQYEIAQTIKKMFKLKNSKINPCKIKSLNLLEQRPQCTTLNINKYEKLIGSKIKSADYYLNLIKKFPKNDFSGMPLYRSH